MDKDKKDNSFKLDRKQIFIGIFALIILALIFFISRNVDFTNKDGKSSKEISENSYNSSKIMRVDLNDIKSIDFDLDTCDVRIQKSSTNPYVEYTNLYKDDSSYEVESKFKDGNLKLSSEIKGKELYMKNKIQIVRIFLPKNKNIDSIKGRIGAGDVKITDLTCKDVDLNLESGNISFDNSNISGKINNNSGTITMKKSQIKNSKLTTKVGDIVLEDSKLSQDENLETENGDINIKTKDPIDSFNINAKLNVGNFVLGNVSYRNIIDGYSIDNNKKKTVTLSTKVGDILFNQGEGAVMEKKEYITSPDKEGDEDFTTPVDKSELDSPNENNEEENN